MKKPSLIAIGSGLTACCLSVLLPAMVAAATPAATQPAATAQPGTGNNGGQALEIAPPVITLTVNPGQTVKTTIQLRDISSGNLIVSNQINDFVAAGEDGTPKILLDGNTKSPFSIKDWITPVPSLELTPHQIKTLTVTLNVPANASPGGHYGVIRFTGTPPELHGTGVSLSASLGALMLVTVNGNIKHSLVAQELSANKGGGKAGHLFESAPINFVEKIKNTGNVHEEPTGHVTITDMFGKKIAALNVNIPPHNVLPDSTRKFTEPLDSTVIGNKRLFGRYKADMNVTYGNNQTLKASMTFWVIPYRLIAVIIVLLVGGFFLLRFILRRYNRRIISRAQKK